MKSDLKPATARARALLEKLQALAERGMGGEKTSAQDKLARLKARFDFGAPNPDATPELFAGSFRPASKARKIYSFTPNEYDVANSVKWAIESATKIPCRYRAGELLAEATPPTARRLGEIAAHIAHSFSALLDQFGASTGASLSDRAAFVMGLYDGMMNDARPRGQPVPSRPVVKKGRRGKRTPVTNAGGLHFHPYSVALSLGKQIRFSAPLEQIAAELAAVTPKPLAQETGAAGPTAGDEPCARPA